MKKTCFLFLVTCLLSACTAKYQFQYVDNGKTASGDGGLISHKDDQIKVYSVGLPTGQKCEPVGILTCSGKIDCDMKDGIQQAKQSGANVMSLTYSSSEPDLAAIRKYEIDQMSRPSVTNNVNNIVVDSSKKENSSQSNVVGTSYPSYNNDPNNYNYTDPNAFRPIKTTTYTAYKCK